MRWKVDRDFSGDSGNGDSDALFERTGDDAGGFPGAQRVVALEAMNDLIRVRFVHQADRAPAEPGAGHAGAEDAIDAGADFHDGIQLPAADLVIVAKAGV